MSVLTTATTSSTSWLRAAPDAVDGPGSVPRSSGWLGDASGVAKMPRSGALFFCVCCA